MTHTLAKTLAALLVFMAPALARDAIPVPRLKPAHETGIASAIPVPRANPHRQPAAETPPAGGREPGTGGWPAQTVSDERQRCGQLLKGLDISYRELAPIGTSSGCGAPAPLAISAVAGVTLDPPATMSCDMGYALYRWIGGSLQPAALRHLKTRVTVIHTASSYVCRGRNGQSAAKLSEHGKANALDMSGFAFASGTDVTVGDGWGGGLAKIGLSRDGSFLDSIRSGACSHFTTVLGPGSDAYHGGHFHVDTIRRKNDYRICQ